MNAATHAVRATLSGPNMEAGNRASEALHAYSTRTITRDTR